MDPLLQVEDIHSYYGKSHILHGISLEVGRGEVVGLSGPQRGRQEHDLEGDRRPRPPERGPGAVRWPAHHRDAGPPGGAARDRLCSRGPADLPAIDGDREFAHRARPPRRRQGQEAGAARQDLSIFPGARRAALPGRRHPLGRRAADAGDRPGDDARTENHAARRADRRADAAHGVADQGRLSRCCTATRWRCCWSNRTCR